MIKQMNLVFAALLSLFIGTFISYWSFYFITYSYDHDKSYQLPADCVRPEREGDGDCLSLTDYETNGFPLQFHTSDWQYDFKGKPYGPGTEAIIDQSLSWPLFISNSVIWALLPFSAYVVAQIFLQKSHKKKRKKSTRA